MNADGVKEPKSSEYVDALQALRDLRKEAKIILKCLDSGIDPTREQSLAFLCAIIMSNGVEHIDD